MSARNIIELVLLYVVPLLVAGGGWVLRWKYQVDRNDVRTESRLTGLERRVEKLGESEGQVQELRLLVAEQCIRRDDYVFHMTSLDAKVSAIGASMMRLEERTQSWPGRS